MLQTAKNVELELLTNPFLTPVEVLELQDLRNELKEREEILQKNEDLNETLDELQEAYYEHGDCEREKDDLAAERDAAITAYAQLQSDIVDWAYANIDNEQLRNKLLDKAYESS